METNPFTPPTHSENISGTSTQDPARLNGSSSGSKIGLLSIVIGIAFAVWIVTMCRDISPFVLAVAAWAVCPYLIICGTGHLISTTWAKVILTVALVAMAVFGLWAFDKVNEDAQGGIILLFAPGYQVAGAIVAVPIILIVNKLTAPR